MKLIINTAHQRFGGGVQVALSFINECKNFPEHEYHVFVGQGLQKPLNKNEFPENFEFYDFDFGIINLRKIAKINHTLKRYEKEIMPDCVISTSGPTYFNADAPQIIGFTLPLYVYPESPYFKTLSLYRKCRLNLKKAMHFYFFKKEADAYVVQTNDMNRRVRNALATEQVFTVTNTHNGYYSSWDTYPPKLRNADDNRIRLLTLSSYYPHKNLEIIPEVAEELQKRGRTNVDFVLTIEENIFREKISRNGLGQMINIGPVPPAECPSLYNECDIMFLPTLAESFSASYPEAMVMKMPIVTTDLGFARSICHDAALYFRPKDPASAADKIEQLLDNESLRLKLVQDGKERAKEFDTAQDRARKYLSICEKLTNIEKGAHAPF